MDNSSLKQNTSGALEIIQGKRTVETQHISVCVCTYKRPVLLENLMNGLLDQETGNLFTYSLVIVDNDPVKSAEAVVRKFQERNNIKIEYQHESTKGLTYARNKSLDHATGDYIAILDDDEVPAEDWLLNLYQTINDYDADAVFGTVLPEFEIDPPAWILNRRFFYWRDVRKSTGARTVKAVTNNVLLRRDLVIRYNLRFDHSYAYAGGEDQAFFLELLSYKKEAKYVDCKDAIVYEFITADRCDPDYIQKRNILEGRGNVIVHYKFANTRIKRLFTFVRSFAQSYLRILAISSVLPFLLIYDRDLGAEYYYKNYYQLGVLLALFNFSPYLDRKSIGLQ